MKLTRSSQYAQLLDSIDIRWSVAIFAAREDVEALSSTIEATFEAVRGKSAIVDVIVNGNRQLSQSIIPYLKSKSELEGRNVTARIWDLAIRDKAHAWNQYVHIIWPGSEMAFFCDGYARPMPDALDFIAKGMTARPDALAGTAVPSQGHSAKSVRAQMMQGGGFQGSLHAIRGDVLRALRDRGFRVPLGLYRVDSLLGAVLRFGLDPMNNSWKSDRIVVCPDATWAVRVALPWRFGDLKAQFNRMIRQARGHFENRAFREHMAIRKRSPETLPETSRNLVMWWLNECPVQAARLLFENPLGAIALFPFRHRADWSQKDVLPSLVATATV